MNQNYRNWWDGGNFADAPILKSAQQEQQRLGAIPGAENARVIGACSKLPERPPAQLAESLDRMESCLSDLASGMSALSARIDPVLRPQTAAAMGQNGAATVPVRCSMAERIDAQSDFLCNITAGLRDMLDRLEV